MPLIKTAAAAASGRVLRSKDRMSLVRRLFAVVFRIRASDSVVKNFFGVFLQELVITSLGISSVCVRQTKLASKR